MKIMMIKFIEYIVIVLILGLILMMNDGIVSSIKVKGNKMLRKEEINMKKECGYNGAYCDTCYGCYTEDKILYCECMNDDWNIHSTSINTTSCNFNIENDDGYLVCSFK